MVRKTVKFQYEVGDAVYVVALLGAEYVTKKTVIAKMGATYDDIEWMIAYKDTEGQWAYEADVFSTQAQVQAELALRNVKAVAP